jgi:hypothetical protein
MDKNLMASLIGAVVGGVFVLIGSIIGSIYMEHKSTKRAVQQMFEILSETLMFYKNISFSRPGTDKEILDCELIFIGDNWHEHLMLIDGLSLGEKQAIRFWMSGFLLLFNDPNDKGHQEKYISTTQASYNDVLKITSKLYILAMPNILTKVYNRFCKIGQEKDIDKYTKELLKIMGKE